MTAKFSKFYLFVFASLGMVFMHVVSVIIGAVLPLFLPKFVVQILVIGLFLGFGIKLIVDSILCKNLKKLCSRDSNAADDTSSDSDTCDSEYEEAKQ